MIPVKLPPEGLFLGTGVYPTDTDTLLCTMIGHYSWQTQYFSPFDMLDKIEQDNQGNLAQVWGYARGFSPRLIAEWFYALDEIGVDIPAPDWESFKNLTEADYADVFEKYKDRFGAGLLRFIREAKKRGIYTAFLYTSSNDKWVPEFSGEGGEYYLGYDFGERYNVGLNTAKEVIAETGKLTLSALTDRLIGMVREHTDERHKAGWGNIMATSSNFHLDYEVLGGAEIPVVEDFAFPSLNFSSALSRGLYRQHKLPMWGSHLAHEHYSWLPNSDSHRWDMLRAGLYMKYMAGSKMIINESGNWFVEHTLSPDSPKLKFPQDARDRYGIIGWGGVKEELRTHPEEMKKYLDEARPYFSTTNYDSPICRKYREIMSDFWNYVKANGTPEGQPESTIALAKGNGDLTTSFYNHNYAIAGLYDIAVEKPQWFQGAPERGWKLARDIFFPQMPVLAPYVNLYLSGTPYGQADIVSFAKDKISADFLLSNYKALMFAGWNTCSEEQYAILKEYVYGGGTLFISLPQLSKNDERDMNFGVDELVNGGDFSELCGVRVKGRGPNFYWAMIPPGSDALGCEFPRRFGILGVPMGDLELTDDKLEILVIDDEEARPIVTRHRYGKGKCYFLNTWTYPGALDVDEGPGSLIDSGGLMGYIYRAIANESRGNVYITDDKQNPGVECKYICYSYFPEDGSLCLYNIDFEASHTIWVHQFGIHEKTTLAPGEFRRTFITALEKKN